MKYSICTTSRKEVSLKNIIIRFSSMPITGIEIWDGHIDDFLKEDTIDNLKKYLNNNHLECACISPYFNLQTYEQGMESLEIAKKCIAYCKELNCNIIRTFLGDKPYINLSENEKENIIFWLKEFTKLVKDDNIKFAIETHFNMPSDNTEFILELINVVGSSNLKVLFDGFNYHPDKLNMMEEYAKLSPYVVHHHIKNYIWEENKPTSLNSGDVDFEQLMKMLKNSDIYCSFEYFCKNQYQIIENSIKWINKL